MTEPSSYDTLIDILDSHPTGCPDAPEIREILALLFSEEDAALACSLAFAPRQAAEVAERAGVSPEQAQQTLERLADRGVILARDKGGVVGYSLLPLMPGIFEFPFMRGERSELTEQLAPLWQSYNKTLGEQLGSPGMRLIRVIPVQEEVESVPGVLTYEMLFDLIDASQACAIAHCACRESEQGCEAPREACMIFDDKADFLVERGFARYLTKDEMKEKLREFDQAGLVHQVNNAADKLTLICNCCPCCCHMLRSMSLLGNPNVVAGSGFLPEVDVELCVGCGKCADERCPVEAIAVVDGVSRHDESRCIGCGLCVTGCENGALTLVRREGITEPPPNTQAMGLVLLQEKGKLERFIEVNTK